MDIKQIQTEIADQYFAASRALIGAMLREPHMYQSFRIPAIWFQDTPQAGIAKAIETVIELSGAKVYTASAVRIQAGVPASEITEIMEDRTPIELAYGMFIPIYERYVETICANCVFTVTDAKGIQELQKQIRSERLVLREGEVSEKEDLITWAIAKLEGHDPTYPTTPHLKTLTENNVIRHYAPGDLVIIAGRPGMGKTQYMLNKVDHFFNLGMPGAVFSLEMSRAQLQRRLLSMRTGKNTLADWSQFTEMERRDILEQAARIKEMPVSIETIRTIEEIERFARMKKQREGLEFILVDYLQLVVTSGKKNSNREQDVSEVSRRLKSLAMELQVPVIAISQLSRAVETRGGTKRPMLSDLRESGSLEQDADIVQFIYRPAYYEVLEPGSHSAILLDERTELQPVEVIIAKNRHGKLYTASVHYTPVRGFIDPPAFDPNASAGQSSEPAHPQMFPAMPKVDTDNYLPF